jgi:hypothetical protein
LRHRLKDNEKVQKLIAKFEEAEKAAEEAKREKEQQQKSS